MIQVKFFKPIHSSYPEVGMMMMHKKIDLLYLQG